MKTLLKNAKILSMKDDQIREGHIVITDNRISEIALKLMLTLNTIELFFVNWWLKWLVFYYLIVEIKEKARISLRVLTFQHVLKCQNTLGTFRPNVKTH